MDYQHELDAYHIGLEVHKRTSVINGYPPEVKYVHGKDDVFWNTGNFPMLQSETERKVKAIRTWDYSTCLEANQLETGCRQYDYTSLNEFIGFGKNEGLTHIVADENPNRAEFLNDVFKNEEKFPYLTKIYDSSEHDYEYHLKIFRINYEKFESVKEFN